MKFTPIALISGFFITITGLVISSNETVKSAFREISADFYPALITIPFFAGMLISLLIITYSMDLDSREDEEEVKKQ